MEFGPHCLESTWAWAHFGAELHPRVGGGQGLTGGVCYGNDDEVDGEAADSTLGVRMSYVSEGSRWAEGLTTYERASHFRIGLLKKINGNHYFNI